MTGTVRRGCCRRGYDCWWGVGAEAAMTLKCTVVCLVACHILLNEMQIQKRVVQVG